MWNDPNGSSVHPVLPDAGTLGFNAGTGSQPLPRKTEI